MTNINRFVQIKSNNLKPARGRVLLSEPLMGDFYFGRSVVLLIEHNSEGSFGLIVNKAVDTRFNDLLPDFPEFDAQIYLGGPVEANRLFILHRLGDQIGDSQEIIKGLYWGGNMDDIKEMISLNLITPDKIRFFAGYSGWGAGQLESEMKRNSWAITQTSGENIFLSEPDKLWKNLVKKLGHDYFMWQKFPKNPSFN